MDSDLLSTDVRRILLASPRGFCAGVVRAIEIVDLALDCFDGPVYVRREIVHNFHVVRDFEARGVRFVQELDEVPDGATAVFSAHGVSPKVREQAAKRGLRVIDATCPLVTKVHLEAIRFARMGYEILLVGHAGHEEVEGTMGEAASQIRLVSSVEDAERIVVQDPRVAYPNDPVDETRHRRDAAPAIRRFAFRPGRHLLRHAESAGRGPRAGRSGHPGGGHATLRRIAWSRRLARGRARVPSMTPPRSTPARRSPHCGYVGASAHSWSRRSCRLGGGGSATVERFATGRGRPLPLPPSRGDAVAASSRSLTACSAGR
jgi:hypothetical protein